MQAAENAWNTREPERVALVYTEDSVWRNRDEFVSGRAAIVEFLRRKWDRELDYALRKELWSFHGNRIAVRFQYESHDEAGQWFRSYGNELWEFTGEGLMRRREASINDLAIDEADRRITARGRRASAAFPSPCAERRRISSRGRLGRGDPCVALAVLNLVCGQAVDAAAAATSSTTAAMSALVVRWFTMQARRANAPWTLALDR